MSTPRRCRWSRRCSTPAQVAAEELLRDAATGGDRLVVPRAPAAPSRAAAPWSSPGPREPVREHLVDHRRVHPGRRRVVHGQPEVAGVGHVPGVQPATVEPAVAARLVEQHAVARHRVVHRHLADVPARVVVDPLEPRRHHPRLARRGPCAARRPARSPTPAPGSRTGTTSPSRGVARRTYSSDPSWCGWSSRWRTLIP